MRPMADTPEHTIELLRRLRAETQQGFADVKHAIDDLTAETRIGNAHIVGLVRFENYATTKMAELDARLARVEKRLDISDPSVSET